MDSIDPYQNTRKLLKLGPTTVTGAGFRGNNPKSSAQHEPTGAPLQQSQRPLHPSTPVASTAK